MKTKLMFAVLIIATYALSAQDGFYYYKGQKIDLKVDRDYMNIALDKHQKLADSISQYFDMAQADYVQEDLIKVKFKYTLDELEYIKVVDELKKNRQITKVFPYFERKGISPIGTSDIFYLKLKEIEDTVLLKKVTKEKNIRIMKQVAFMPHWFVLSIRNSDFNNSLDASNYFHETAYFADTDPAFMFNFKPDCTNDPMFNQLWGLSNSSNPGIDINVCNAWSTTRGEGINVAVVDQGIYMTHNDLSANMSPESFDAQSGTSPSVFISGNNHGTHVCGTVAAVRNNKLQVAGVTPESKVIGVSHDLSISSTISSELAGGISWAWQNGADIITNSWGDQGGTYYDSLHSTVLEAAIINAITQGRNGKGCVVTFASGNCDSIMDYPAYFDPAILTVGAIDSSGSRASFSGHGNELDVVAPGVSILSTFPYDETGSMSGTSMATPHVAGVAALVLSVNPSLTGQQVRNIIESTAQKVRTDLYTYSPTVGHPNGTWNNETGYGLVDAYNAVQKAQCTVNFTNQAVTADTTVISCGNINVRNVTVDSGKLTLKAAGKVNIISGFQVKQGAKLEIIEIK